MSATVGVGEGVFEPGGFLRLLLAVQIPKVMIRPKMNPIEMAKNTSFFIYETA